MKKIEILGTGCPKCKQTTSLVEQVVAAKGLKDVEVVKVEDIMEIMKYNVMSTPAVVVDQEIKIKGRVPTVAELEAILVD